MRLISRFLDLGRGVATQTAVSVAAVACVAAMFAAGSTPSALPPVVVSDTGKSVHRVADGAVETRVLRLDSQQQAAMASLSSFTPTLGPPIATPPVARAPAPRSPVAVLPPPRPTTFVATAPPAAEAPSSSPATTGASPMNTDGWRIAGFELPGSARVRKYVPTGDDIMRTGSNAWKTSADTVRKVAGLTSLLGL